MLYNVSMKIYVLSLFSKMFTPVTELSICARATKSGLVDIYIYDIRDFAEGKHKKADDSPYGGGPGMVMYALPILKAVEKIKKESPNARVVITSPRGKKWNDKRATNAASLKPDLIFICGHYEGIDARVKKALKAEEFSIGNYTLTGGELPAMVMIDSIIRRLPGVLGNDESLEEGRAASKDVYTRPEILEWQGVKYKVPKILLSGNHAKIEAWRSTKNSKK